MKHGVSLAETVLEDVVSGGEVARVFRVPKDPVERKPQTYVRSGFGRRIVSVARHLAFHFVAPCNPHRS